MPCWSVCVKTLEEEYQKWASEYLEANGNGPSAYEAFLWAREKIEFERELQETWKRLLKTGEDSNG